MKFCSQCGHSVSQHIPQGDSRLRYVCDHCQTIHYQNPNIVAGCVPTWGTQVLLCRRAIEPRKGFWTLPAGFMENGETVELRNFGVFKVKHRRGRLGRNPRTGQEVSVPEKKVVIFKAGLILKGKVK